MLLEGLDWEARLQQGNNGLVISSGANQILITPDVEKDDQSTSLSLVQIQEMGEEGSASLSIRFLRGKSELEANLVFAADGSLQIVPEVGLNRLSIFGAIRYGVLPGLYLEDIIFDSNDYSDDQAIHMPPENLFWALLGDGSGILAFAWPEGKQLVRLVKSGERFSRFEIELDGKPVYLKILTAPGIWHKEDLKLGYLEKDVELGWRRPFDGRWKTQLLVNHVPTTWLFQRESPRKWIPMLGFFRYPVWFDGPMTMLHLSKKIPPKGHCFVYPLDGHPKTPFGFVDSTPVARIIRERRQRIRIDKEQSEVVPNVGYVHCWGTSLIQRTIYKNGLQARERELLNEHVDYCVDYVKRIQQQSLGYYDFIQEMVLLIDGWAEGMPQGSQESVFLEEMQREIAKVEDMYHSRVERGGRKTPQEHIAYAEGLGERLKELILDPGRESYPEAKFILDNFNALAAATDEDVPAGFGITIRHMFQKAGSICANKPKTVRYAQEIRKRIWEKTKIRNYETTGL